VLENNSLPAVDRDEMASFHQQLAELRRVSDGAQRFARELGIRNENMRQALHYTPNAPEELTNKLRAVTEQLREIDFKFNGTRPQASSEEVPPEAVSLNHRMGAMLAGTWGTTSAPTQTMRTNYTIARESLPEILDQLKQIDTDLQAVQSQLESMKAPWTPGRLPELR
jgi:predicted translin family RNA/ssDNA-binding protein